MLGNKNSIQSIFLVSRRHTGQEFAYSCKNIYLKMSHNNALISIFYTFILSGLAITQGSSVQAQDSIDEWYESRPPSQLCELYRSGAIQPDQLPGGRSSNPCANFPDPK